MLLPTWEHNVEYIQYYIWVWSKMKVLPLNLGLKQPYWGYYNGIHNPHRGRWSSWLKLQGPKVSHTVDGGEILQIGTIIDRVSSKDPRYDRFDSLLQHLFHGIFWTSEVSGLSFYYFLLFWCSDVVHVHSDVCIACLPLPILPVNVSYVYTWSFGMFILFCHWKQNDDITQHNMDGNH